MASLGRVAVLPGVSGPGTFRVTLPPDWLTVGVPLPRLLPPDSVALTKVAPAGTASDTLRLVRPPML